MEIPRSFDLSKFMFSHFPSVEFEGNLFGRWPVGIRFDIGFEHVSRATKLHEFIFSGADYCVLVSQDWLLGDGETDIRAPRITPLFSTPGIFRDAPTFHFDALDVRPFEETPYRLTWTRLSLNSFNADQLYQAIANSDHGRIPSLGGRVYAIDERARIIMHMYDDRGLDIIATDKSALLPLYERFGDWILDNQRRKIDLRFEERAAGESL